MAHLAKKSGSAAMAVAAAALLVSGCYSNPSEEDYSAAEKADVKCSGINACKGTSACATASSSCKGHNSCKGHGWLKVSESECDEKGGTVIEG